MAWWSGGISATTFESLHKFAIMTLSCSPTGTFIERSFKMQQNIEKNRPRLKREKVAKMMFAKWNITMMRSSGKISKKQFYSSLQETAQIVSQYESSLSIQNDNMLGTEVGDLERAAAISEKKKKALGGENRSGVDGDELCDENEDDKFNGEEEENGGDHDEDDEDEEESDDDDDDDDNDDDDDDDFEIECDCDSGGFGLDGDGNDDGGLDGDGDRDDGDGDRDDGDGDCDRDGDRDRDDGDRDDGGFGGVRWVGDADADYVRNGAGDGPDDCDCDISCDADGHGKGNDCADIRGYGGDGGVGSRSDVVASAVNATETRSSTGFCNRKFGSDICDFKEDGEENAFCKRVSSEGDKDRLAYGVGGGSCIDGGTMTVHQIENKRGSHHRGHDIPNVDNSTYQVNNDECGPVMHEDEDIITHHGNEEDEDVFIADIWKTRKKF